MSDFYTFDDVVRGKTTSGEAIDEMRLKRLVSEGEISAFREGDIMKFKKSEIDERLAGSAGTKIGEVVLAEITLEDEPPCFEEEGEILTDDLVFESGEDHDFEVAEAIHVAGNPPHEEDVPPTPLTISIAMSSGIATFTPDPKTGKGSMELDFGRRFNQKAARTFIRAMGIALGTAPKIKAIGRGRSTEITAIFDT